eukprot:m.209505 g.209505  ORF g.209505 m.209505 type:complete len:255 (-) comp24617_c0_seq1:19-783(-)
MASYAWTVTVWVYLCGALSLCEAIRPEAGNHLVNQLAGRVQAFEMCDNGGNFDEYRSQWCDRSSPMLHAIAELGVVPVPSPLRYDAVVHLRCGDVPFTHHRSIPWLPRAYYEWVGTHLRRLGVQHVTILSCGSLHTLNLNTTRTNAKCRQFATEIGQIIGINSSITCLSSIRRSWAAMLSASRVLVSTGGSFSFVPGIARVATGRLFLSPLLGRQGCLEGKEQPPGRMCPNWHLWPHTVALNKSIDYFNFSMLD